MVEAPEVPHHHHHKTGVPWFDLIVPIAVLCISVASLLTSLQSEKSMHALVEQNTRLVDAQSTPLLMLDSSNLDKSGKRALSVTLTNVGTGPAEISWFHISDAHGMSYTGGTLYERVAKLDPKATFTSQQIAPNADAQRRGTCGIQLAHAGCEQSRSRCLQPAERGPLFTSCNRLLLLHV